MTDLNPDQLAQLADGLVEAIAAPERQVADGQKQVTYRSTGDLVAAHEFLKRERQNATGTKPRRTLKIVNSGRGFHE